MENQFADQNIRRSERRTIMTEHAKAYFSDDLANRVDTLNKLKTEIDNEIELYKQCSVAEDNRECQNNILRLHDDLNKLLDDTLAFMARHECDVTDAARDPLALLSKEVTQKVNEVLAEVAMARQKESHPNSEASVRTNTSKSRSSRAGSNAGSVSSVVKRKMKLEAARIRFEYANRNNEMKRQSAEVEEQAARLQAETERRKSVIAANQELLKVETEYAVAEAEYRAISEEGTPTENPYAPLFHYNAHVKNGLRTL